LRQASSLARRTRAPLKVDLKATQAAIAADRHGRGLKPRWSARRTETKVAAVAVAIDQNKGAIHKRVVAQIKRQEAVAVNPRGETR